MIENCGIVVGASGFFGRGEGAKPNAFTVVSDSCNPRVLPNEGYSFESVMRILLSATIVTILGMGTVAKIALAVVQLVMILMVYLKFISAIHNHPVHENELPVFHPCCAERVAARNIMGVPVPLRDTFKVLSVNNSVLAVCERNEPVGLIEWLGQKMSCLIPFHTFYYRTTFVVTGSY